MLKEVTGHTQLGVDTAPNSPLQAPSGMLCPFDLRPFLILYTVIAESQAYSTLKRAHVTIMNTGGF